VLNFLVFRSKEVKELRHYPGYLLFIDEPRLMLRYSVLSSFMLELVSKLLNYCLLDYFRKLSYLSFPDFILPDIPYCIAPFIGPWNYLFF